MRLFQKTNPTSFCDNGPDPRLIFEKEKSFNDELDLCQRNVIDRLSYLRAKYNIVELKLDKAIDCLKCIDKQIYEEPWPSPRLIDMIRILEFYDNETIVTQLSVQNPTLYKSLSEIVPNLIQKNPTDLSDRLTRMRSEFFYDSKKECVIDYKIDQIFYNEDRTDFLAKYIKK
jgi:hypothetical protein